jgi:hypothetical protein
MPLGFLSRCLNREADQALRGRSWSLTLTEWPRESGHAPLGVRYRNAAKELREWLTRPNPKMLSAEPIV